MSAETFEHSAEGSVKADVSPYEAGADVRESFPISLVRGRYLLFDVNGKFHCLSLLLGMEIVLTNHSPMMNLEL